MNTGTATPTAEVLERWLEDNNTTHHLVCMKCDAGPMVVRTLCGLRMTVDQQAYRSEVERCSACLAAATPHLRCLT